MKEVVEKWIDSILANYPIKVAEVTEYVGEAAERIVKAVLDIYGGRDPGDEFHTAVDDLMRFLATDKQLSAADSVGMIFELRKLIADAMKLSDAERLRLFEAVLSVAMVAFDSYVASREKIYELRLKEKDRDLEIMRKVLEYAASTLRPLSSQD